MKVPNYVNFKYTVSLEEKEFYRDFYTFEIKEAKYFEILDTYLLKSILTNTYGFISGGKAKGGFMKLKLKFKKDGGINPKWLAQQILNELHKRKELNDCDFKMWKDRLALRKNCG